MGKKRKSEATRLDEVDRTLYSAFCSAANSVSQIYTQAMAHQKLAFQAGERHALEKLYQLILRNNEEGSRVTVAEIVAYLQHEIEYGDDVSVSPSIQLTHQQLQSNMNHTNAAIQNPPCMIGSATVGHAHRTGQSDQSNNAVFAHALSNPVGSSLFQPYHLAHNGEYNADNLLPQGNGVRNQERNFPNKNQESNSLSLNDLSMDMHSDSPSRGSY